MTRRRCLGISLIATLLVQTGSHLAVLQLGAWASMAAKNLRTHSASQAFSRTFDGRHPCPLCLKIRRARSSQARMGSRSPRPKVNLFLASSLFLAPPVPTVEPMRSGASNPLGTRPPPLLTPPKAVLA